MDEEYKPIITDEERATRAGPAGGGPPKEAAEKRRRLLRRLVPCGLLAVLCVGLVTVGAQLIESLRRRWLRPNGPFR